MCPVSFIFIKIETELFSFTLLSNIIIGLLFYNVSSNKIYFDYFRLGEGAQLQAQTESLPDLPLMLLIKF